MDIEVSPRKLLAWLLIIIALLLIANIFAILSKLVFHLGPIYGLVPLFEFDREENIPTLFSTLQLLAASFLLVFIGSSCKSRGEAFIFWFVLALVFFFLAIDETAQIHELTGAPIRAKLNLTGLLYFGWIVPYGLATLILGLLSLPFLSRLPEQTRWLFVTSGIVYVAGAVGIEMLGGNYIAKGGTYDFVFSVYATCEETLEMLGIALFVYALAAYISSEFRFLRFTVRG